MKMFTFGFFQQRWKENDELFLVVSDTDRCDVSTTHRRRLQHIMSQAKFPSPLAPVERAITLLKPSGDNVSVLSTVVYLGSVEISPEVWRHFVFVEGHDFSFKDRLGREFITSTADLSANFGLINGPVIEEVIRNRVAYLTIVSPN